MTAAGSSLGPIRLCSGPEEKQAGLFPGGGLGEALMLQPILGEPTPALQSLPICLLLLQLVPRAWKIKKPGCFPHPSHSLCARLASICERCSALPIVLVRTCSRRFWVMGFIEGDFNGKWRGVWGGGKKTLEKSMPKKEREVGGCFLMKSMTPSYNSASCKEMSLQ